MLAIKLISNQQRKERQKVEVKKTLVLPSCVTLKTSLKSTSGFFCKKKSFQSLARQRGIKCKVQKKILAALKLFYTLAFEKAKKGISEEALNYLETIKTEEYQKYGANACYSNEVKKKLRG